MRTYNISVHAHFYQPPRFNPATGHIGVERIAAPYRNGNERATDEIYQPNADHGNFASLSLDFDYILLDWLDTHHYRRIIDAIQPENVLGLPLHQSDLPLLSRRDQLTQLRWGQSISSSRFGVVPTGVFLPNFAADFATLQAIHDVGYEFTVLRSSQVEGLPRRGGAGPYRINLPSGDYTTVFVINDGLSASMLHDMQERGGAGHWTRHILGPHARHAGNLTLLYVDGEELGRHRRGEAAFMHYLLSNEVQSVSYRPVTLNEYYAASPDPIAEIELLPYVRQETEQQMHWRHALQQLMTEANLLFVDVLGDDAWPIRDEAATRELGDTIDDAMLKSQVALQRAWSTIDGVTRYPELNSNLFYANVAFALLNVWSATGDDLASIFRERLPLPAAEDFDAAYHSMSAFFERERATV